jgi:hypothetical protein
MPFNWEPFKHRQGAATVWVLDDGTTKNLGIVTHTPRYLGGRGEAFIGEVPGSPREYPSLASAQRAVETAVTAAMSKKA